MYWARTDEDDMSTRRQDASLRERNDFVLLNITVRFGNMRITVQNYKNRTKLLYQKLFIVCKKQFKQLLSPSIILRINSDCVILDSQRKRNMAVLGGRS